MDNENEAKTLQEITGVTHFSNTLSVGALGSEDDEIPRALIVSIEGPDSQQFGCALTKDDVKSFLLFMLSKAQALWPEDETLLPPDSPPRATSH